MVRSLEEMASTGSAKLSRKAGSMATSYNAAKGKMASNYNAMPFGPTRKSNYSAGVSAATYRPPDANKWATNWKAKMSE